MIPLANSIWPSDTAVVLLQVERSRAHETRGSFIALPRDQIVGDEPLGLCGVRADAVCVLDPTLPEDALFNLKCAVAAGSVSRVRRNR